jgi:hypothetical protein
MLSREAIEEQLTKIGYNFRFWGRSEVRELHKILMEDEVISQCVNGEYTNGFAMLLATNHRILLVHKKPLLYLTVEDMRFELITDFNYSHRLVNATICISTPNKSLTFTSWNKAGLRKLLEGIQLRVHDLRSNNHMTQFFQHYYSSKQGNQSPQPLPQWAQIEQPMPQQSPRHVEPQSYYAPNLAPQPAPENANPTVTQAMNHASFVASKLAAKRSALGTYTRSKMPSFRHHTEQSDAQTGEVYPGTGAYRASAAPDYQMPYEY